MAAHRRNPTCGIRLEPAALNRLISALERAQLDKPGPEKYLIRHGIPPPLPLPTKDLQLLKAKRLDDLDARKGLFPYLSHRRDLWSLARVNVTTRDIPVTVT